MIGKVAIMMTFKMKGTIDHTRILLWVQEWPTVFYQGIDQVHIGSCHCEVKGRHLGLGSN